MSLQEMFRGIAPGAGWAFDNVVGIDPSLRKTGLAKITSAGAATSKTVNTAARDGWDGNWGLVREITGVALAFTPVGSLVLMEEMFVPRGGQAAGSVIERAWLWGRIYDEMKRRSCVVVVVNNTHRAMLATGSGAAKKPDVKARMRARFPEARVSDDNQADALALAAAGAWWAGFPIEGPTHAGQNEAMRRVPWPTREESN
jgi:crossover junction endodeoxyribonuclease RuvC